MAKQKAATQAREPKKRKTAIETRKLAGLRQHPRQSHYFPDLSREELLALAESIRRDGLRQPPEVLPDGTIITGHQRVAAARLLGWDEIEVIVRYDLHEQGPGAVERLLVVDNLERRHLTPLQRARAIEAAKALPSPSFTGVEFGSALKGGARRPGGDRLGTKRNQQRYLAVLKAPRAVQQAFDDGRLSLTRAARVATLPPADQERIAAAIEAGTPPDQAVQGVLGEAAPSGPTPTEALVRLVAVLARTMPGLEGRESEIDRGAKGTSDAAVLRRAKAVFDRLIPSLRAGARPPRRGRSA